MTRGMESLEHALDQVKLHSAGESQQLADKQTQSSDLAIAGDDETRHDVAAKGDDQDQDEGKDESSEDGTIVKGKVKWFNVIRGYGFVTRDDGGADVFVYQVSRSGYTRATPKLMQHF